MALNKETIASIAGILGMNAEDITAKITSENEETLEIPKGQIFTDAQLEARDKVKYKDGKDAGTEMLIKDLKKKYSYEFEGKKVDDFLTHHDEQLKSKYSKDSSERVIELEADLKKVNKANEELVSGLNEKLSLLKQESKIQGIKNQLLSVMPDNTTIDKDDVLTLFLNKHEIKDTEDGGVYLSKNGEPLKDDKTATYLKVQDVFNTFVEPYKKIKAGRGGGNETGDSRIYTSNSVEDFQDEWQKKNPGKSTTSSQYSDDYGTWRQEQKKTA